MYTRRETDLHDELTSISNESGSTKTLLARFLKRKQRQQQRDDPNHFTQRQQTQAIFIYELTGYDDCKAAEYLYLLLKKRNIADDSIIVDNLKTKVAEWFINADMNTILSATNPRTANQETLVKAARKFIGEHTVAHWVSKMNRQHGVAPSSMNVFMQLREAGAYCEPGPPELDSVCRAPSRTMQSVSRRWRLKWGGVFKKIRIRDVMAADEMTDKVCPLV